MPRYRRLYQPGGCWFFTVNLQKRQNNDLLVRHIELLRASVKNVRRNYPFRINACVVLPEHIHCIWTLPEGDSDFSVRWRLIKSAFSRSLPANEPRSVVRRQAGERGIWQRHYWEHLIRDETDFQRCFDYVHVNPVKHGHVQRVRDWPYSSFHQHVEARIYPLDWCGDATVDVAGDQ